MPVVYLLKSRYPSYYQYRKDIRAYRDDGYIVRNCTGGVVCFSTWTDFRDWMHQK